MLICLSDSQGAFPHVSGQDTDGIKTALSPCVFPGTTTRLGPCLVTSLPNASKVEGAVMNGIRSVRHCVLHCVLADETKMNRRAIERACGKVSAAHSAHQMKLAIKRFAQDASLSDNLIAVRSALLSEL